VSTFTASDFSRTFPTNSQGSDHGWGSHYMVMGGAVVGGATCREERLGKRVPSCAVSRRGRTRRAIRGAGRRVGTWRPLPR
jgi:hypothetical protein